MKLSSLCCFFSSRSRVCKNFQGMMSSNNASIADEKRSLGSRNDKVGTDQLPKDCQISESKNKEECILIIEDSVGVIAAYKGAIKNFTWEGEKPSFVFAKTTELAKAELAGEGYKRFSKIISDCFLDGDTGVAVIAQRLSLLPEKERSQFPPGVFASTEPKLCQSEINEQETTFKINIPYSVVDKNNLVVTGVQDRGNVLQDWFQKIVRDGALSKTSNQPTIAF